MKSIRRRALKGFQYSLDSVLIAATRVGLIDRYQPLYGDPEHDGDRSCIDRWRAIEAHLSKHSFSVLDIGSQLGFFTLSSARAGGVCIGIERVYQFQQVAEAIRRRHEIQNASFLNMELNTDTVIGLPSVDVTFCMSVFHHWVIDWGQERAEEMQRRLCSRTQAMVFETGQCDEIDQAFSKHLGFMNPDCRAWALDFLARQGFKKIEVLGVFPTHLGPHPRHLIWAEKAP